MALAPPVGHAPREVAIKQFYPEHSKKTAMAAGSCRGGALGGKFVVVVDEDVDMTNPLSEK